VRTRGARLSTVPCIADLPSSDLAEVRNEITTYRLFRADRSACIGPAALQVPARPEPTPTPTPAPAPTPEPAADPAPSVTIDP